MFFNCMETNNNITGISVVIVAYNSSSEISECILSVYENNDIDDELEVIVVDNNSKDYQQLCSIIQDKFPKVILLRNETNGGYGQGNNIGIARASKPIIMIMNPDVRLFEPVFAYAIEQYRRKPRLMLLGMQQYNTRESKGASFLLKFPTYLNLLLYKICVRFDLYIPKLFFISGACFFLNKKDFLKIGGFDENIFLYGEETDINERILRNKSKIIFDSSLGYIHPMHNRGDNVITMQRGLKSALYLCDKFGWSKTKLVKTDMRYYRLLLKRSTRRNDNKQSEAYKEILEYLNATLNELSSQ